MQYHPDVSKHAQAGEMFKSIRRAYETLSNEAKRTQYDRELRLQEDRGRVDRRKQQYYSHQFVDEERLYRWAEAKRRRMAYYDVEEEDEEDDSDDETTMAEEGSLDQERAPFVQVLQSAFLSLFLLKTLGAQVSITCSSLMAMFDPKLDAGYKTGHLIAWILGGRNGVMLTLCIQFTSWVCGKTSSSMVTLMVVAMWIVSNLARYAPLPTGAVLTLLHMSMKLQVDLT
ncbi:Protein HLJ1 [Linum grandiflorum]